MRIFHRGLILVGAPLVIGLLFIGSLYLTIQRAEKDRLDDARARKGVSLLAHETTLANELLCLTVLLRMGHNEERFKRLFSEDNQKFEKKANEFEKFLADSQDLVPERLQGSFNKYRGMLSSFHHRVENLLSDKSGATDWQSVASPPPSPQQGEKQGEKQSAKPKSFNLTADLTETENQLTRFCNRTQNRLNLSMQMQTGILAAALIVYPLMCVYLAAFYRKGILQRLNTIAKNIQVLAGGGNALEATGGTDEIAQLNIAFETMYARLQIASKNEQALFDNASDVICVLDRIGRFTRINPACQKNWGFSPDDLKQKKIDSIISADEISRFEESMQAAMTSGAAVSCESNIRCSNGESRVGLWSLYWSAVDDCLYCIVHDVTEQKKLEAMRQEFLRLLGSDLKVPLSTISESLSLLCSNTGYLSSNAQQKFTTMKRNLGRLVSLVNDLLQIAEMEFGSLELKYEQVDLQDLLKRATQELEFLISEKKLTIELKDSECLLDADSSKLMQVTVNLLSNAIKYSPESSSIVIDLEDAGDYVICRIRDHGRGVPAEKAETIFERFGQVNVSDGKRKAGTGLGLPICKEIVEAHNGEIAVLSQEGSGSTFWFRLPKKATNTSQTISSEQQSELTKPAESLGNLPATLMPAGIRRPLFLTGVTIAGVPFLIGVFLLAGLGYSSAELSREREQELRNRDICSKSFELMGDLAIGTASPGIAMSEARRRYIEKAPIILKELRELLSSDRVSLKYLERIKGSFEKLVKLKTQVDSLRSKSNTQSLSELRMKTMSTVATAMSLSIVQTNNIERIIERAEAIEFINPEKELRIRQRESQILLAGLAANLLLSMALASQFSRGISKRLAIMADNAGRVARDEPLNPVIGGNDELTDLDVSFHKLAAIIAESRRKERAVFDNCKDVLCTVSRDGRFITTNPAAADLWGYTKTELSEKTVSSLTAEEDRAAINEFLSTTHDEDRELIREFAMFDRGGELIHTLWSISCKRGEESLFCVVQDISKQKELEKLRSQFLAVVSHDLRTPLNAISTTAELANEGALGELSPTDREKLSEIHSNCQSLIELVTDVLDLEKLEAGQMALVLSICDLESFCTDFCSVIEMPSQSMRLSGEIETLIKIDQERLLQALQYLARFLKLRASDQNLKIAAKYESGNLQFSIVDSGPPMTEHERVHIFDRYKNFSLDAQINPQNAFHADLRLPLAAKIIEAHGGELSIEERESHNCFIASIPISRS